MEMTSRPLQPSYMHIQVCTTGEESEQVLPKDNTHASIVGFLNIMIALSSIIDVRVLYESGYIGVNAI